MTPFEITILISIVATAGWSAYWFWSEHKSRFAALAVILTAGVFAASWSFVPANRIEGFRAGMAALCQASTMRIYVEDTKDLSVEMQEGIEPVRSTYREVDWYCEG